MTAIDLNTVEVPFQWSQIFAQEAPIDIDIGAGKGRFLNELATSFPERNFLAVERAHKYYKLCCDRAARRGFQNVRLLCTTAEDLFFRLIPPETVDRIFVLFPDPWPKKRHHKRRFLNTEAAATMRLALKPGGQLLIKSDHHEYAEVINEVVRNAEGYDLLDADAIFEDMPISGFEQKYRVEGRPIHRFALGRNDE